MSIKEQHSPISGIRRLRDVYTYRLAWLLLVLFSAAGWLRMIDSLADWQWLNLAGVQPGPLYLVISGALWGLVGLAAALWMLFRRPWGRMAGLSAAVVIALTYWLDRLLFDRAPGSQSNIGFALLMTVQLLLVVILGLRPFAELRALLRR